jgi:hypothetical protein
MTSVRTDRSLAAWLGIALVGLLGLVLIVTPEITDGHVPGNIGDARFNNYILEHGYRWLAGKDISFWNATFFYPFPLTTAFSVNHLGTVLVYSAFRVLGLDREDAFSGWYLVGYIANFGACAYVLRRLSYGWLGAGLGAFLFTFGLPITVQNGHAQLLYRFCVPLAIFSLLKFSEKPSLRLLLAVGFWTVWQFYCEIYTGYFLSLLLVSFVLAHSAVNARGTRGILRYWPSRVVIAWRSDSMRSRIAVLCAGGALFIAFAWLLAPYLKASRIYGFKRSWEEIASMLPRPASYLLSGNSRLWTFSWSDFDALPMRHEHAMFMGGALFLSIIVALGLHWSRRTNLSRDFASAILSLLFLVVLTLWVHGYSIYRLVAELPGANSIRAVTRIGTILLFPSAILLASSIRAVSGARISAMARTSCLVLIAGLLIYECSDISHDASLKSDWLLRLKVASDQLPGRLPDRPILILAPRLTEAPYLRELDAMLLAQEHGWPTLNGYSGNVPPGHFVTGSCQDAAADIAKGLDFLGRPGNEAFTEMAKRVVFVGFPQCGPIEVSTRPQITSFAGPLPTALMANTEIAVDKVILVNNAPVAVLAISNHGNQPIPAQSSTGMPVRVSAEYVRADDLTPGVLAAVHWDSRQEIDTSIMPGESVRVDVALPPPPRDGSYVIVVSMVQDGFAWFHNNGMKIAVSKQRIIEEGGTCKITELNIDH